MSMMNPGWEYRNNIMDSRKQHSNTTIHDNIRGIVTCTIIYMVLFIFNYEFNPDNLVRALSSLIDIIFSG